MPLRDFKCQRCGHIIERLVKNAYEDTNCVCPQCSNGDNIGVMVRLPAASSFVVKGFNAANGYSKS